MVFTDEKLNECVAEVSRSISNVPFDATNQRKLSKKGFSFSHLPVESQIQIWDHVWKSGGSFWLMIQAFLYCEKLLKKDHDLILIWPTIKSWQDEVSNWGLCDGLSKIYSKVLEVEPDSVLPTLTDWNTSPDPWKRRQSIVSLLYYSSVRKTFLPYDSIISRVDNLLNDKDYYVQKGIGWTLRELYRAYPVECLEYLYNHAVHLTSIAFATVNNALQKDVKEELKQMRKKHPPVVGHGKNNAEYDRKKPDKT